METLETTIKSKSDKIKHQAINFIFFLFHVLSVFGALARQVKEILKHVVVFHYICGLGGIPCAALTIKKLIIIHEQTIFYVCTKCCERVNERQSSIFFSIIR